MAVAMVVTRDDGTAPSWAVHWVLKLVVGRAVAMGVRMAAVWVGVTAVQKVNWSVDLTGHWWALMKVADAVHF